MAARFWVGGAGTWDASDTTHWAATSGGAGGQTVPGSGDTVTLDGSSGGGTVTLGYSPNVISITMGAFTGTFDASTYSPTVQTFNISGTATRTFNPGSGTWTITGNNATVWNQGTTTNLTIAANTATLDFTYSGSTGTRTMHFQTAVGNYQNVKISAGSDLIVNASTNVINGNLDFTGFSGTWNNTTQTFALKGDLTLSSSMSVASNTGVITINPTSGTSIITSNGVVIPRPVTINATAGVTVQLADDFNMSGASTIRILALTQGIFNANGKNVTLGGFQSSNTNTRVVTMGSGTWTLTGNSMSIWDVTTITNLTFNRSSNAIIANYSGSTGVRTISHANTGEVSVPHWSITAGSDTVNISNTRVGNLDFTGFTGILGTGTFTVYGNLTFSASMTVTASSNAITMTATSGSKTIDTKSVVIERPLTIGENLASTTAWSLASNLVLGVTRSLGVAVGTFSAGGFDVTTGFFSSSNTNTRTINMGSGTWTVNGTGTVWQLSTMTNLTFNSNTSTLVISDTSASTKTFAHGSSLIMYNILITGGGTGAVIFGANSTSINDLTIKAPKTVSFTTGSGSTTTIRNNFNAVGTSGNLVTLVSGTPGSAFFLSKSTGIVASDYLSLTDSTATGGAFWYAGSHSTNVSNNTGWIFRDYRRMAIARTQAITRMQADTRAVASTRAGFGT